MELTWGQLREEVKYTAKQVGLNVIWIPWTTAVLYWMASWIPVSSGTQRRVAIARAFFGSPEVMILDEPTKGLDPEWRLKFKRFLREYAKEGGRIRYLLHPHTERR